MKKILALFALCVLLTACGKSLVFQSGVVTKSENNDTYGYKYRVEVENIAKKGGMHYGSYVLLTNENYRVGDTIRIK
jgi:hypothetical protein